MSAFSSIKAQFSVVFAVILQDMNQKYGHYHFGTVWVILEPLLMITVFIVLFGVRGRGEFGLVEPPLFILAAFLPFKHIFMGTMKDVSKLTKLSRKYKSFNQINWMDVVIAIVFRIFMTGIIGGCFLSFLLFWLLGINTIPANPVATLFYIFVMSLFGCGLGMLICRVEAIAEDITFFTSVMTLPLLFMSAVFFPMTSVPEPYRTYLAYNPLVHPMEFIRESWFHGYESPVANFEYMGWWLLCMLILALMLLIQNDKGFTAK